VVVVVVLVVVGGGGTGAQTSFDTLGVTIRAPNWSFTMTGGTVAFGHLSL